jgi:hypothetical protein
MGQLASERAEDLFRRKRAIFHVFDWPAHEEADAKEGEIDLDAAGCSDRFDELISVIGAGDEAGEIEMTAGVAWCEQVKRGAEVDDERCLLRGQLAAAQRRRHKFAPPDVLACERAQCLSRRRRRQLPAPKLRGVSRHRCARPRRL